MRLLCGHHGSPGPGGGREPPGTQGARGWPGVGPGSGLTSPGPGPGSTLTAPGGAALTSFFRRLWCLSALILTSIARALRRLSSRHRESPTPWYFAQPAPSECGSQGFAMKGCNRCSPPSIRARSSAPKRAARSRGTSLFWHVTPPVDQGSTR